MITRIVAWDYIKKYTSVYVIEDDVVYFHRNNRSYRSYIEATKLFFTNMKNVRPWIYYIGYHKILLAFDKFM